MHETSVNKPHGLPGLRSQGGSALTSHPAVRPTGDMQHILTDLTSVRPGKTNMDPTTETRETLCREPLGKWDNTILSEKQLTLLSPPHLRWVPAPVLSALPSRSSSWLLSHLPCGGQRDYRAHTGSREGFIHHSGPFVALFFSQW